MVQGYPPLDVIRRDHTELIEGLDRAATTVSALRTAVIAATAPGNLKLALGPVRGPSSNGRKNNGYGVRRLKSALAEETLDVEGQ